jgi:hypothetical protein
MKFLLSPLLLHPPSLHANIKEGPKVWLLIQLEKLREVTRELNVSPQRKRKKRNVQKNKDVKNEWEDI